MRLDLDCVSPFNHSWAMGVLKHAFPRFNLVDYHLREIIYPKDHDTNRPNLVYLDDEEDNPIMRANILANFKRDRDIIICKMDAMEHFLARHGYKHVKVIYFMAFENAITMRFLNRFPEYYDGEVPFYCLNRRPKGFRHRLIQELHANDLIKYGHVTFQKNIENGASLDEFPHVIYNSDISLVKQGHSGAFERLGSDINGVECSWYLVNDFHVAKTVPGKLAITAESALSDFFPTEKTIQPFIIGRIPFLLTMRGRIKKMMDEGFDMFDDILDLSYDMIDDPDQRIVSAIRDNSKILKRIDIDPITRIKRNQDFLINEWLPFNVTNMIKDIEALT